jgi:drug/metabolite transporter (DMT)-like permease
MKITTLLVLAGAVSAGVHAGLAPEHLQEWPPLGAAFVAAAAAAALAVVALVLRPASPWPPRTLGAILGGLVVAYALTRLAALPPLDPDRESLDLVGVCTTAVEALGVAAAVRLASTVTPGGPA